MASPQPKPALALNPELFHISFGPVSTKTPTIIYLHGMISSHLESANMAPYLSDAYHLLLVDLNGHSNSAAITPYTIPAMADRVASLIRRRARNGTAHVVGVSMGGYVALDLARRYPSLVESVFNAGAVPLQDNRIAVWMLSHPGIVWYLFKLSFDWLPTSLVQWMQSRRGVIISDELLVDMRRNLRWDVVRDVLGSMLLFGSKELAEIRPRVVGVAAALSEDIEAMRREGLVLRENGNRASRAVVLEKAVHAWVLQYPELFARGVRAWVEGEELPEEYEALE
ncbi:Alpha/Beta hydrolase protein [Lasiosphaeris hirsuta]|uniref:Alpha/Beta hydrolase protein n=1 Tax=Lasiosphaeris hirsuta TaxID=260670 RepID=A0AA40DT26_9PEZI|nr:Alpha/Beta hydrolase protein [Lasiosphaeris hirsuta]